MCSLWDEKIQVLQVFKSNICIIARTARKAIGAQRVEIKLLGDASPETWSFVQIGAFPGVHGQ